MSEQHDIQFLADLTRPDHVASIGLREAVEAAPSWWGTALLINGQAAELVQVGDRVGLAWGGDPSWGPLDASEELRATVLRLLGEAS